MSRSCAGPARKSSAAIFLLLLLSASSLYAVPWTGMVRDKAGHAVGDATISLQAASGSRSYTAKTAASGAFVFADVEPQSYQVTVKVNDKTWNALEAVASACRAPKCRVCR